MNASTFAEALQKRAEEKHAEYRDLLQEQHRLALRLDKCMEYLEKLNDLLEAEGLEPVGLRPAVAQTGFAKPGNRAKDMPLRRPEWNGMSLAEVVKAILDDTNDVLHADALVLRIYETESKTDKKKAKRSLVSTLRAGADKGLWQALGKNKYRRAAAQQEMVLAG